MLFLFLLLAAAVRGAEPEPPPPAKLKVTGFGLLGNLQLKQAIKLLEFPEKPPPFFDADFIEDTRLILASRLRDDGYLQPKIRVVMELEDGGTLERSWPDAAAEALPRTLRARAARFELHPGVLFHYRRILFTELSALSQDQARAYFVETGLLQLKGNRVYTPERLDRGVANLQKALNQMGYRDARVSVSRLDREDSTGAVAVEIEVRQEHRFRVRSVREEVHYTHEIAPSESRTNALAAVYSQAWAQDYMLGTKTNYYGRGYPETTVSLTVLNSETADEEVFLDLLSEVWTGPPVRVGQVQFEGAKRTKIAAIRHQVPVKTGEPLNRMSAERGRYRLSRLGGFDRVELEYTPVTTNLWDVTYRLKEGKRMDVSLLLGFGSYDLLRGGIEFNHYDLWGRAHSSRLRLVQSFKSSSGDYTYTIPQPFGADLDFFLNATALRREEVSFLREEYGGGAGVRQRLKRIDADATLRYYFGVLQATEAGTDIASVGAEKPVVGEFLLDLSQDRRDNPLNPQRGYRLSANLEYASPNLGGEVGFQRVELAASGHLQLGGGRWLHVGVRHGVAATWDQPDEDLPFARRFYPGGENSVRGYKEGEAAPRDDEGNIIGAETYLSGSVELEQAITPKWSLIGFVDGVAFARNLRDYPGDEVLYSAGGGIRWKTLIGPLRVEYGYNLNPRPKDPSGTLLFSLGYPF